MTLAGASASRRGTRQSPAVVVSPPDPDATAKARRLACRLGVRLDHVDGTGPGGRIYARDVQAAAELAVMLADQPVDWVLVERARLGVALRATLTRPQRVWLVGYLSAPPRCVHSRAIAARLGTTRRQVLRDRAAWRRAHTATATTPTVRAV